MKWRSLAAAVAVLSTFVLLQIWTIDYGTRINDVPYVARSQVDGDVLRGSGLERAVVVSPGDMERETTDLWLLRFKLYSVEADEIISIMALARMKPGQGQFDPHVYQYGGAYLYPLGAWFYALDRIGVIYIGSLADLLGDPARMDRIWIAGRAFILLSFVGSAAVLYALLRYFAPVSVSLLLLGLYLFCPASIAFSLAVKPHWYALVWVNMALLVLAGALVRRPLSTVGDMALGLYLGLAVGSAITFSIFAVFCWVILLALVLSSRARAWSLVRTPVTAVVAFVLANPYYLINWRSVFAERELLKAWYRPDFHPDALMMFVDNSMFAALGFALTILILAACLLGIVRPRTAVERIVAATILLSLLLVAGLTANNLATWHTNLRYAAHTLPLGLLLLALTDFPRRTTILAIVLTVSIFQAAPLKLAYLDENDPAVSTRLRSAAWIDQNIPPGERLCINSRTPSPYEVPPFQLARYELLQTDCQWRVAVERETDAVVVTPNFTLVKRFRPRFSPEEFPLVFGHINPQISIYRRG